MKALSIIVTLAYASASAALGSLAWAAPPPLPAAATENLRAATLHLANGSGFVAEGRSGKLYIMTNWHVCHSILWKGALHASLNDGVMLYGVIAKQDPGHDLCAARLDVKPRALKLAGQLPPLSAVYTRGYPGHILTESSGYIREPLEWDFEFPIEDVGECFKGSRPIHGGNGQIRACHVKFHSTLTSLYARPGASGSPVVDAEGRLVGVVSSWHPEGDYEAGIVQYGDVKEFLSDL